MKNVITLLAVGLMFISTTSAQRVWQMTQTTQVDNITMIVTLAIGPNTNVTSIAVCPVTATDVSECIEYRGSVDMDSNGNMTVTYQGNSGTSRAFFRNRGNDIFTYSEEGFPTRTFVLREL